MFENDIQSVRKQKNRTHANNTIRTRKSNIFYSSIVFFLRNNKRETHMHHTACTLVIQTNAQSELKINTHTHKSTF
jgi:hypothetical protein